MAPIPHKHHFIQVDTYNSQAVNIRRASGKLSQFCSTDADAATYWIGVYSDKHSTDGSGAFFSNIVHGYHLTATQQVCSGHLDMI